MDPTECELMKSADKFAEDYCNLLEEAKEQDSKVNDLCNGQSFELTKEFRQFKAAGTEGLVDYKIRSIILPLLSDHVLREANHYLRLLETTQRGKDRYGFV